MAVLRKQFQPDILLQVNQLEGLEQGVSMPSRCAAFLCNESRYCEVAKKQSVTLTSSLGKRSMNPRLGLSRHLFQGVPSASRVPTELLCLQMRLRSRGPKLCLCYGFGFVLCDLFLAITIISVRSAIVQAATTIKGVEASVAQFAFMVLFESMRT